MRRIQAWLLMTALVAGSSPASAQEAPAFPAGRSVVPAESAAVADQGHSLFDNPAGPAFTEPRSIEMYQSFIPSTEHPGPGDVGRGLYWSLPSIRFAWQYTGTEAGPGTGVLAFSQSRLIRPGLAFGSALSFSYFNYTERPLAGIIGVRLGLQARPHRAFSMGFVIDNLLSPVAAIDSYRTRGRVGFGLRPLGDALTLTADAGAYLASLSDDPDASLLFTLGLEPVPGIRLHGSFEWMDFTGTPSAVVGLGATLRFGSVSIGDQGFLKADAAGPSGAADSFYVGIHGQRAPTVLTRGGLSGQIWEVMLRGDLEAPPPENFLTPEQPAVPLLHQLRRLRAAQRVPQVKVVLLAIDDHRGSLAELQELRAAVEKLRASGRWVVAYLYQPDLNDLYLASACDVVLMHPTSALRLETPHRDVFYLRGLLEKAGLEVEVVRSGDYKSAPEGLSATGPSSQTREMNQWVLSDLHTQQLEGIAAGRKVSVAALQALYPRISLSPEEALEAGLVDELVYYDQVENYLEHRLKRVYELIKDDVSSQILLTRWGPRARVGLVYLEGEITREARSLSDMLRGKQPVNALDVVAALEEMREDKAVRAVVLRVDSPGGSAFAADEIWRAVKRLGQEKPVVVSMGSVAASGAYYLTLPAQHIMADAATLTGSIGVYSAKINASGLLERLAVHSERFSSLQEHRDPEDMTRAWTAEERAQVEHQVKATYQRFLQHVAKSRGKTVEDVETLAAGRIWTGKQALDRGLIDSLGGLDAAVEKARALGGIRADAPLELEVWPERRLRDSLMSELLSAERGLLSSAVQKLIVSWKTQHAQEDSSLKMLPLNQEP